MPYSSRSRVTHPPTLPPATSGGPVPPPFPCARRRAGLSNGGHSGSLALTDLSPSLPNFTSASLPARTAGTHARARSHTPGRGRSGGAASTGRARARTRAPAHPHRPPLNSPPPPPSPRGASRAARPTGPAPALVSGEPGKARALGPEGGEQARGRVLARVRAPPLASPLPPLPPPLPPIGSLSYSIPSHLFPFTHWRGYFSSAFPFLRILLLRPILHALEAADHAALSAVVSEPSLLSPFPSVPVSG